MSHCHNAQPTVTDIADNLPGQHKVIVLEGLHQVLVLVINESWKKGLDIVSNLQDVHKAEKSWAFKAFSNL